MRGCGSFVSLLGLGSHARAATNVRARAILVKSHGAQLARIAALAERGQLKPTVSQTFTLDEAREAHVQSETGRTRGKIVLRVRD